MLDRLGRAKMRLRGPGVDRARARRRANRPRGPAVGAQRIPGAERVPCLICNPRLPQTTCPRVGPYSGSNLNFIGPPCSLSGRSVGHDDRARARHLALDETQGRIALASPRGAFRHPRRADRSSPQPRRAGRARPMTGPAPGFRSRADRLNPGPSQSPHGVANVDPEQRRVLPLERLDETRRRDVPRTHVQRLGEHLLLLRSVQHGSPRARYRSIATRRAIIARHAQRTARIEAGPLPENLRDSRIRADLFASPYPSG